MLTHRRLRIIGFIACIVVAGWALHLYVADFPATNDLPQLLLSISFLVAGVGICTGLLGWYVLRRAERVMNQRIDEAIAKFQHRLRIEQVKSEEAQRHIHAGYMQWFSQNNLDAAIEYFEAALRSFPHGLGGYTALGYAYYNRGDTQKAYAIFQQAISLFPHRKEPYRDMASILIRDGDLLRALHYVEEAVRVDPTVRRDLLEDPLFDILKQEKRTRRRFERVLTEMP